MTMRTLQLTLIEEPVAEPRSSTSSLKAAAELGARSRKSSRVKISWPCSRRVRVLDHDLEAAVVERHLAGRRVGLHDHLAPAALLQAQHAVVAERIIAGPTGGHVRGPATATAADRTVIAFATETPAPRPARGRIAHEAEFGALVPDFRKRLVAYIAANIGNGRQRRTSLDRPIGLDAKSGAPGLTAPVIFGSSRGATPSRFVRPEVSDVVARNELQPAPEPLLEQRKRSGVAPIGTALHLEARARRKWEGVKVLKGHGCAVPRSVRSGSIYFGGNHLGGQYPSHNNDGATHDKDENEKRHSSDDELHWLHNKPRLCVTKR